MKKNLKKNTGVKFVKTKIVSCDRSPFLKIDIKVYITLHSVVMIYITPVFFRLCGAMRKDKCFNPGNLNCQLGTNLVVTV